MLIEPIIEAEKDTGKSLIQPESCLDPYSLELKFSLMFNN